MTPERTDLAGLPGWIGTTRDEDAAVLAFAFWKEGLSLPEEDQFLAAVHHYRRLVAARRERDWDIQFAREIEEFSVVLARTRSQEEARHAR